MNHHCSSISVVMFFKQAWFYLCLSVNSRQYYICCMSVLQWSCYSSQYIAAKETCCQPLASFSLCTVSLCLSHFFIAHGLREQLAFWTLFPLCEHTLIGSPLPQKQSSMGCRQPAFCWCCSKKSEGKNKGRKSSEGFTTTCLGMSVLFLSASPAVMRINGGYRISLMSFCQMECNGCLLFAELCPPPHCPADSLHPLQSFLLTPPI